MNRAILIAWVLVAALTGASLAQDDKIELFADQGMSTCELSSGTGLRSVYLFQTGSLQATGAGHFSVPKPACWTGATWVSDTPAPGLVYIGSSQTQLDFAYQGCLQPPVLLATINYLVSGSSPTCCPYSVKPGILNPDGMIVVDCNFVDLRVATAGSQVMINPTVDCPNCEVPPPPPPPPTDKIELFADQGMSNCELAFNGPNIYQVHMFHTGPDAAIACQFMAPKPACWTNAIWTGDTLPFLSLGNSQTDLSLSYGACLQPPIYLGTINYFVSGPGTSCCPYPVLPALTSPIPGRIAVFDCALPNSNTLAADAGQQVMINPNSSCPHCELGPVAVQETTWGRIKALYGGK